MLRAATRLATEEKLLLNNRWRQEVVFSCRHYCDIIFQNSHEFMRKSNLGGNRDDVMAAQLRRILGRCPRVAVSVAGVKGCKIKAKNWPGEWLSRSF